MPKFLNVLALSALAAASQANLVVNGGFEADAYTLGSYSYPVTSVTGWNINPNGNIAGIGVGYLGAPSQQIDLSGVSDDESGSGINQDITTVSGGLYTLKFDVYTVDGYSGKVSAWVNGSSVFSGLTLGTYSVNFVGTGTDNIKFTSDEGVVSHIDNVSVEAVPEPASMAALGVGALALLRRRRNAR